MGMKKEDVIMSVCVMIAVIISVFLMTDCQKVTQRELTKRQSMVSTNVLHDEWELHPNQ